MNYDYSKLDLDLIFKNFQQKHGLRQSLKLMAKLFEGLYENRDLDWLRRQQDLYDFDLYNMLESMDSQGEFDIFDEPWTEQGPYIRLDNVDKIREIHSYIETSAKTGENPLLIVPDDPDKSNYLRNLADDLTNLYENLRCFGDLVAYPFLYKDCKLYQKSLVILGETVPDLFDLEQSGRFLRASDYFVENGLSSRRLLIVDETENLCWPDYDQAKSRLETFAREQKLCVAWFRKP